ncbi:virulence protein [Desulfomicrobium baculatum]|uniref:Virulence protein-like protein n=1 Tax=Desulfomicrobium baculatum (strain DSM 4028 / VKM B-1378 / X) TaxID=525897 RepID=C7LQZ3_DESBD|nr:virulence protein [Desulfomicrobium baculatum]ACU90399.1 Virulence protein-like protein [Desulfomicrobium baculatum DSM 4028]
MEQSKIKIYQSSDGQARIDVRLERDTVWLSQAQMAELFGRDQSVISRHIRNALTESEVNEESNMQKMHTANSDRPVAMYDLDVVISVGYRIKSERGCSSGAELRTSCASTLSKATHRLTTT